MQLILIHHVEPNSPLPRGVGRPEAERAGVVAAFESLLAPDRGKRGVTPLYQRSLTLTPPIPG